MLFCSQRILELRGQSRVWAVEDEWELLSADFVDGEGIGILEFRGVRGGVNCWQWVKNRIECIDSCKPAAGTRRKEPSLPFQIDFNGNY